MSVVVVVVISASCAGYGVRSFFAKLFFSQYQLFGKLTVFLPLNMDFRIILEYTFSQFQDKNVRLTVRKKNLFT